VIGMTQDAERGREWFGFGQDPKLVQEWLRQNNLAYGGLIAVGVALVQPLMTAGALDLSARICVVAGFWHIYWIAGVGMLAAGLLAVAVHSAGYARLERGHFPSPPDPGDPGDPGIPES
jgi:hypothetical protein